MKQELRKELFCNYLDLVRIDIYKRIIDANSELIHKLYKKRKNQALTSNPLWLLHGGELINLYSDKKNQVRTKDIDLKLYFTGDYNIPKDRFERAKKKIGKVNIDGPNDKKVLSKFKKT